MLNDRQTATVRAAIGADAEHGAVVPPLHLSTNFTFESFGCKRQYDYTRSGNPTRDQLGEALAELENGAGAVVTASGMAAVTLVLQLLESDQLLVVPHDCYGGCHRAFHALARRGAFRLVSLDFTRADLEQQLDTLRPDLIWVETPSNPLLRITDIARVAEQSRRLGARLVVDNTFLSPALQRPLDLGADLVLHSTTKYLNGHSDVVGGAVIASDAALVDELAWWSNCLGLSGAPFDAFMTLRGVRSLHARMSVHEANARDLAEALVSHPAVSDVYYPGLEHHPGHELARRQQAGFGAMISFELHGGERAARTVVDALRRFSLAESLGGVESLVAHPASMTHAAMPPEDRAHAGIADGLLRLSVGIERGQDLIDDVCAALDRVAVPAQRVGVSA